MGKNKLRKFEDNKSFVNVYEPALDEVLHTDYKLKGQWHNEVFGNDNPIVLEIGCGRGEYSIAMARRFPGKNFIGIDIKGARIWEGAKIALEAGLNNVCFVRTYIEQINSLFSLGEIAEIWATFPDPHIKKPRKRLSCARFLNQYKKLVSSGSLFHLKTDSTTMYEFTREVALFNACPISYATNDLYGEDAERLNSELSFVEETKTYYEKKYLALGKPIKYISFVLDAEKDYQNPPKKEG